MPKLGYKRTQKFKDNLHDYWNKNVHPLYKGDNASICAKHARIKRKYGKADRCENKICPRIGKRYEWANKSGLYKPERSDWIRLCASCHRKYDMTIEKAQKHSAKMKKFWQNNDSLKKRYSKLAKNQKRSKDSSKFA